MAKVDATEEEDAAAIYEVQSYPTLFFFINGSKIEFAGDRTKDGIVTWLEKKILPPTTEVTKQEELDRLKEDGVSIVLFSKNEESLSKFNSIAVGDDNNSTVGILCRVLCCRWGLGR